MVLTVSSQISRVIQIVPRRIGPQLAAVTTKGTITHLVTSGKNAPELVTRSPEVSHSYQVVSLRNFSIKTMSCDAARGKTISLFPNCQAFVQGT